jgi:hypothetical protein
MAAATYAGLGRHGQEKDPSHDWITDAVAQQRLGFPVQLELFQVDLSPVGCSLLGAERLIAAARVCARSRRQSERDVIAKSKASLSKSSSL